MMTISQLLANIAIYIGFSTFFLLAIMLYNPRLMLQDYPHAIQAVVSPKTTYEKIQSIIVGLPFVLVLLTFPFLFVINSQAVSLIERFFYAFLIIWSFNVWDWLVLDWLLFCKVNAKFFIIPGTEKHPAYKDYGFHFRGFLIGTLLSLLTGVAVAVVTTYLI